STEIPSTRDIQRNVQSEAIGFRESVAIEVQPCRAAESRPCRHGEIPALIGAVRIHQQNATKTFGLHLLQIIGDRGFVRMTIQPPPITAEPGRLGRISKTGPKLIQTIDGLWLAFGSSALGGKEGSEGEHEDVEEPIAMPLRE